MVIFEYTWRESRWWIQKPPLDVRDQRFWTGWHVLFLDVPTGTAWNIMKHVSIVYRYGAYRYTACVIMYWCDLMCTYRGVSADPWNRGYNPEVIGNLAGVTASSYCSVWVSSNFITLGFTIPGIWGYPQLHGCIEVRRLEIIEANSSSLIHW